ncbi:hypothetical protein AB6A40_003681 [Gnathostoma spinigerum]|uniref:Ribokinase n=1 Tax=Gnathostoma spinigerum TaxID=75299 RepID=A0ABD6EK77_9BILA
MLRYDCMSLFISLRHCVVVCTYLDMFLLGLAASESKNPVNDIVVFGSINQDLYSYTERFPQPGETVIGKSFKSGAGGKGANQAAQAARLGAKTAMIGCVGDDVFGPLNIEALKKSGVNTDFIEICSDSCTGTATIIVNNEGENMIVVAPGANYDMTPEFADKHDKVIASAKIILCQNEIKPHITKRAFEFAKRNNVKTFLNFAPATADYDKDLFNLVDILCTNETETEILSDIRVNNANDAQNAAEKLLSDGYEAVIITLGANGVYVADKNGLREHLDVSPVTAVDTTGAGDSFCGAFAFYMVTRPDLSLAEQCRRAAEVATISVQHQGTQSSFPFAKDLPRELIE